MTQKTIFETPFNKVNEFARFVLDNTDVGTKIKFDFTKNILKQIYDNHPLKPSISEPFEIMVVLKKPYKNKCFAIVSPNGFVYTFSIKNALKSKPINIRHIVNSLFRKAISKDVLKRKNNLINLHGLTCQKSGIVFKKSDLTLHHESPYEFNIISDLFLIEHNLTLNSDLLIINANGEFCFKNNKLCSLFRDFHKKFLFSHTSLVSKKYNEVLGSRFKFKNENFHITKSFIQTHITPTSQLNLF